MFFEHYPALNYMVFDCSQPGMHSLYIYISVAVILVQNPTFPPPFLFLLCKANQSITEHLQGFVL